jgi:hypothetical protein
MPLSLLQAHNSGRPFRAPKKARMRVKEIRSTGTNVKMQVRGLPVRFIPDFNLDELVALILDIRIFHDLDVKRESDYAD